MEYNNDEIDVEYKKIYDIETLKNYKEIVKNINFKEYDDTLIDNINIFELEDIVDKNINNHYYTTSIYHIAPIFLSFLFTIGTISIYSHYN
jgi:hypothetical protein